jgi:NAD(P)H-dependent flavin oxidoreductase YrpB (nitropropane dioxygenase family)
MDLCDRLSLQRPVLQAGMGGGLATAELAAAVSRGGGLGTLGITHPRRLVAEVRRARELAPKRPIAVNLLLPFTRPEHIEVCVAERVDAVVLFFGFHHGFVARLRDAGVPVLHQVGTVDQVRRAVGEGADAIVAQGREAGGHLLGTRSTLAFLREACEAAAGRPVVAAGGFADPEDVRAGLAAGASAVLCGTRFLLTRECRAHPEYKRRALQAARTIETTLFGFGWPARHRVVPNAATDRWCLADGRPRWVARALMQGSGPLARLAPLDRPGFLAKFQRVAIPLFGPEAPLEGADVRSLESTPLYAGECVQRIGSIPSAEDAVRALAP